MKRISKTLESLITQVVGGQSVLVGIFREVLKEPEKSINKMEITYFALSVFTYELLHFSTVSEVERTADEMATYVMVGSLPHSGQVLTDEEAIKQYQKRYQEYKTLIDPLFAKKDDTNDHQYNPYLGLTWSLYENVTGKSVKGKMIEILSATPLITQYILDNIDFLESENLLHKNE